jgi:foldase protein PrsA
MKKALNITLVAALIVLTACVVYLKLISEDKSIYISTGFGENVLAKVDGEEISASEVAVLLADARREYEEMFGSDIWSEKMGDQDFDSYIVSMIKAQITRQKCMKVMAQSRGIVLSQTEEKNVKAAAEEYMNLLTKDQIKTLGVSKALVEQMYTDEVIAQRLFDDLTLEVDTEISEDEARVITVQYIRTMDKSTANGILERLRAGESFLSLVKENNPYEYEYTLKRGETEENFEKAAFALATGEVSDVVETAMGCYIIMCISDYDRIKTASNKENIITERKLSCFNEIFEPYEAQEYAEYNEKEWEKLDVKNMPVCSVSFHEIYDKYFN